MKGQITFYLKKGNYLKKFNRESINKVKKLFLRFDVQAPHFRVAILWKEEDPLIERAEWWIASTSSLVPYSFQFGYYHQLLWLITWFQDISCLLVVFSEIHNFVLDHCRVSELVVCEVSHSYSLHAHPASLLTRQVKPHNWTCRAPSSKAVKNIIHHTGWGPTYLLRQRRERFPLILGSQELLSFIQELSQTSYST